MELSGCFVRLYYGLNLCEVNRRKEAVEIVDYLIYVISHYKITDSSTKLNRKERLQFISLRI